MKHVLLLLLTIIGFAEYAQGVARDPRRKKPRTMGPVDVSGATSAPQSGSALPGRTLSTVEEEGDGPLGNLPGFSKNPHGFQVPAALPLTKDNPVTSEKTGSYHPDVLLGTLRITSPVESPSSSLDSSTSRVSSFGGSPDSVSLSSVLSPATSSLVCVKPTASRPRLEGLALLEDIMINSHPLQLSLLDRISFFTALLKRPCNK